MAEVIGYLDRWSARAGESVALHVHAEPSATIEARLVSLARQDGPAGDRELVGSVAAVTCTASAQRTPIGSWGELPLPDVAGDEGWTVSLLVRPTLAEAGTVLAIATGGAPALQVDWDGHGAVSLRVVGGAPLVTLPALLQEWSLVSLSVRPGAGAFHVHDLPRWGGRSATFALPRDAGSTVTPGARRIWLATAPPDAGAAVASFEGLLESPVLLAGWHDAEALASRRRLPGVRADAPAVLAAWDFARETWSARLVDVGANGCHGMVHQGATRLVPGAWWRVGVLDPHRDPAGFAAIHFHKDDLLDAGWPACGRLALPAGLPSGVYGVQLRSGASEDVIPLWVRPARGATTASLAYLAPTYTYLAYGNAPDAMLGPPYWGSDHPSERQRHRHPEFGPSLYSRHGDKSGVSLVSRLRPILTVRPGVRPWGFEADRLLTDWLARGEYRHDVLTDEDVDLEGDDALAPYRVLVTGNHPEYWTAGMLAALDRWLERGGRLLYMGGNGFYWRVSTRRDLPGALECRRAEGGTRPWIAEPGCGYHQLDGDAGGLWRRLGRAPQRVVGVGFAGQGFVQSAPYRVREDARSGWAAFALAGVERTLIGTSGRLGGGAAGQEIDRHDRRLGSPDDAVVLASSQGLHDAHTLRTLEELLSHEPYVADPKVRADLTLTPRRRGLVFATGSMAWVGALDDADVARVTRNVLDRFLDPRPIGPAAPTDEQHDRSTPHPTPPSP